jgi:HK97 family phage prohead protease
MLQKTLSLNEFDLKFKSENSAVFEGYASTYNGEDSYGDTILPGAYDNVIRQIQLKQARMPKMFENHKKYDLPVGKWLSLKSDSYGLFVAGELTPHHSRADDLRASMKHETVDGISVGIGLTKGDWEEKSGSTGIIIKNVSLLREISIVTFPADDRARVDLSTVKGELETIETITDLEAFLREAGGFSKGLAVAVLARAKQVFGGEPQTGLDKEAAKELKRLINMPPLLG